VIRLNRVKETLGTEICISHLEGADYINILSKRKGEQTICWIHGSKFFDENIEGLLGFIRKKILIPLAYRRCDKIITVSNGIREELINHFKIPAHKITTIYNSFDLEDIIEKMKSSIPDEYQQLFESAPVLITHCRLSRQKNLFALIDIFSSAKNQSKIKLVLMGDGELRDELLRHCESKKLSVFNTWQADAKFNLDFDIYFLGYERNPFPYLSRATLYIMTSSWEGFPLSLCEAMASGVPVVSSDCFTGPREIIAPGLDIKQPIEQPQIANYGVLMPLAKSETLTSWAETIVTLLKDKELRDNLISQAKERVQDFDRKKISAQWLDLIEKT
jgi:glycosyltransferase involved in cell wall biosynthesis